MQVRQLAALKCTLDHQQQHSAAACNSHKDAMAEAINK